jgi:transposase InsO family protein
MAEAARHLGMKANMLRRWTRALSDRHNGAFPGKGPVAPDQEALHQRRKKRQPVTTDSRHRYGIAPHLLARECDVEKPTQVWVGDITSVWTAEGGYVAVLLDLSSRTVVGWARSPHVDAT